MVEAVRRMRYIPKSHSGLGSRPAVDEIRIYFKRTVNNGVKTHYKRKIKHEKIKPDRTNQRLAGIPIRAGVILRPDIDCYHCCVCRSARKRVCTGRHSSWNGIRRAYPCGRVACQAGEAISGSGRGRAYSPNAPYYTRGLPTFVKHNYLYVEDPSGMD